MRKLPPAPPRPEHARGARRRAAHGGAALRAVPTPATVPGRGNARLRGRHCHTRGWFTIRSPLTLSCRQQCHLPCACVTPPSRSAATDTQSVPSHGSEPPVRGERSPPPPHPPPPRLERRTLSVGALSTPNAASPAPGEEPGTRRAEAPDVLATATSNPGRAGLLPRAPTAPPIPWDLSPNGGRLGATPQEDNEGLCHGEQQRGKRPLHQGTAGLSGRGHSTHPSRHGVGL